MGLCSPHPQALLQGSPCRKDYGATRPIPAETFLCEESFTKSTPKTSWFLEFQRRGSSVTPFEPPCSQESYYNDEGTLLPEVAAAKLDILMLPEQIGGENFACEVPEGRIPSEVFPKRILPLWHAFDYFPRERKVIAGAGRVDPQYSCRKFGEGNFVSFSYPHHQKCNCAESPSAGLGCVSPQYFCREFGEGALLLLMPAPTKGTVSQNVRAQA